MIKRKNSFRKHNNPKKASTHNRASKHMKQVLKNTEKENRWDHNYKWRFKQSSITGVPSLHKNQLA